MNKHPTPEAELGHAVARGHLTQTLADVSILATHQDLDKARATALLVRKSAKVWRHIADQLRLRIRDQTRSLVRAQAPKNIILAACHEINRSQTLTEEEVGAIVVDEVWQSLPNAQRQRGGR